MGKAKSPQAAKIIPPAEPQPPGIEPAVIVFGMNENAIPQAAWFPESEAALAIKAAGLMQLRAARIASDEHRALAKELRQGQVYAHSRTFAPIVNETLYGRLFELCGEAPVQDLSLPLPASFDVVEAGSLVLALDGDTEGGWWEAVVVGFKDDLLQLRWRYEPRNASFIRTRQQIAMLHPEHVAEQAPAASA